MMHIQWIRSSALIGLILFLFLGFPKGMMPTQAQDEIVCSLSPRLTPNMPGRVRAVSTAGNNLRAEAGLAGEITTQLANNTAFTVQLGPKCVEGLNWYLVKTTDDIMGWTAEGESGVYWLEPTPFCDQEQRAAHTRYTLNQESAKFFGRIQEMRYLPEQKSVLIGSLPENSDKDDLHPALLDYHLLNLETQAITPTTYPDADIVTPELTAKLGITDAVFGEYSRSYESLIVSPRRDRIMYFTYTPPPDYVCAHGCVWLEIWIANVDGTNPSYIGTIATGEGGYVDLDWRSDGMIYLTMIYADATHSTIVLCDDGSCFDNLRLPLNYAYPSISPSGDYIVFIRMQGGGFSNENSRLFQQEDAAWFDLPLALLPSAIWSDDEKLIYYLTEVAQQKININFTPLADLSRSDILVMDIEANYYKPIWDINIDLGMALTVSYNSLNIYCF